MIDKTDAITLRIYPFSRTSHMVSWLTRNGSRLVTSVKGATRNKSAFLGQYDYFYTCELLYYTRNHAGVHIARECTPLELRSKLRTNWRAAQCASWFSALAFHASGSLAPDPKLYTLLTETLDYIAASDHAPPAIVFARFEAHLLELAGIRPNFTPCKRCTVPAASFRFNLASGNCYCPTHSHRDPEDPIIAVSHTTAEHYAHILRASSLGLQSPISALDAPTTNALLRFIGLFLRFHFDTAPIEGRAIALKALE